MFITWHGPLDRGRLTIKTFEIKCKHHFRNTKQSLKVIFQVKLDQFFNLTKLLLFDKRLKLKAKFISKKHINIYLKHVESIDKLYDMRIDMIENDLCSNLRASLC